MFLPAAPPIPTAEDLRAELSPAGILQHFLVDQIALSMDRLAARDEPAPPPGSRCMPSWSGATPPSTAAGHRWCR